jgi:hypothetical protein
MNGKEIPEKGTTTAAVIEISESETLGNGTVDMIVTTIASQPIETLGNETLETYEILVIPIIVAGKGISGIRATEILGTLEIFEMGVTFGKGTRGIYEILETCGI